MAIAVANRYARALADVSGQANNYRQVLDELANFLEAYRGSAGLREVFETPALPLEKKLKVLEGVLARLGVSATTSNFLRVLVSHYRMTMLDEIRQVFQRIANGRMGIVQVKISSASALSEAEQEALRERFREITQRQVELEFHLDDQLLGGLVAQVSSTVYDGSVRGRLDRLRERLIAA